MNSTTGNQTPHSADFERFHEFAIDNKFNNKSQTGTGISVAQDIQEQMYRHETDKMRRKQVLYSMLNAQKRKIYKSPNPNDSKKILIGDDVELEADTLLNGMIFSHEYKKSPSDVRFTAEEHRIMLQTQIMK